MAYKGNGPRAGRNQGRHRGTLADNASKAATPQVSPTQTFDLTAQLAQLQTGLAQRLAAVQAKKGGIQGQFKIDRATVKANKIAGMADTVNDSLERGIIGSSVDAAGRVGVEAEAATGLQQALQTKVNGLLGLQTERIDATNEYYTGVFDVQAKQAALQAEEANRQFLEDLVMRMNDEQGPANNPGGNRPDGTPPPGSRGATSPQQYPRETYAGANSGLLNSIATALGTTSAAVAQLFQSIGLNLPGDPALNDGMNPMANGRRR